MTNPWHKTPPARPIHPDEWRRQKRRAFWDKWVPVKSWKAIILDTVAWLTIIAMFSFFDDSIPGTLRVFYAIGIGLTPYLIALWVRKIHHMFRNR